MTNVMKMFTILSMRVALYREMSVFFVFAASSGVRKYFCGSVRNSFHWDFEAPYQKRRLLEVEPLLDGTVDLSYQRFYTSVEGRSFTASAD